MKLSVFKTIAGCCLVAMVTGLAVQRRAIVQTREANEGLRGEAAAPAIATEPIQASPDEMAELERANRELPKLRNEVRKLRDGKRELEKLQAENERLAAVLKAAPKASAQPLSEAEGFVLREKWSNAGFATPEATVQTFFWALSQRDPKRLAECMPDNDVSKAERELRGDEISDLAKLRGFRVVEKKQISEDKVELLIQAAAGGRTLPMPLRLVNGEWKLSD